MNCYGGQADPAGSSSRQLQHAAPAGRSSGQIRQADPAGRSSRQIRQQHHRTSGSSSSSTTEPPAAAAAAAAPNHRSLDTANQRTVDSSNAGTGLRCISGTPILPLLVRGQAGAARKFPFPHQPKSLRFSCGAFFNNYKTPQPVEPKQLRSLSTDDSKDFRCFFFHVLLTISLSVDIFTAVITESVLPEHMLQRKSGQ